MSGIEDFQDSYYLKGLIKTSSVFLFGLPELYVTCDVIIHFYCFLYKLHLLVHSTISALTCPKFLRSVRKWKNFCNWCTDLSKIVFSVKNCNIVCYWSTNLSQIVWLSEELYQRLVSCCHQRNFPNGGIFLKSLHYIISTTNNDNIWIINSSTNTIQLF